MCFKLVVTKDRAQTTWSRASQNTKLFSPIFHIIWKHWHNVKYPSYFPTHTHNLPANMLRFTSDLQEVYFILWERGHKCLVCFGGGLLGLFVVFCVCVVGFVCFLNVREHLLNTWLQLLPCSECRHGFRHFRAQKVSLAAKQDDHITCSNSATLSVLQPMEMFTLNPSFLSPNLWDEQYTKLNPWLKPASKCCAASSNCQSILHISKTHSPHTPVWTRKATLGPPAENK